MGENYSCVENTAMPLRYRGFFTMAVLLFIIWLFPLQVHAEVVYENENGYKAILEDNVGRLSESEQTKLIDTMKPITEYGNVALVLQSDFEYGGYLYSQEYVDKQWGTESGTLVLIDLEDNSLYIHNSGYIRKNISDETSRKMRYPLEDYIDSGDYYTCFVQALTQIGDMLAKGKVNKPMKHITYALLALVIAMFIMYYVVNLSMKKYSVSEDEWQKSISVKQDIYNFSEHYLHETKKYVPGSGKWDSERIE